MIVFIGNGIGISIIELNHRGQQYIYIEFEVF